MIQPVRDKATFAALRKSQSRLRRGPLTVSWVPGDAGDPTKVAFAVPRAAGNAVVRNRVRRRLRAAARDDRAGLMPGAYLIGASRSAASLPFGELLWCLSDAAAGLRQRAPG